MFRITIILLALSAGMIQDDPLARLEQARKALTLAEIELNELTAGLGLLRKATDVDANQVANQLEEGAHLFWEKKKEDEPDLTVFPYLNPLAKLELTVEDEEGQVTFKSLWRDRLNQLHKLVLQVESSTGTVRLDEGGKLGPGIPAPVSITFYHRVCFQVRSEETGSTVVIGNGPEAYQYSLRREGPTVLAVNPETIPAGLNFRHILVLTDDTLLHLDRGTKPAAGTASANLEDRIFLDHGGAFLGDLEGIRAGAEWQRQLFRSIRAFDRQDAPIAADPVREASAAAERNKAVETLRDELRRIQGRAASQRVRVLDLKVQEASALLPLRAASQLRLLDPVELERDLTNPSPHP
jgi:hypothetical protein